MPANDSANSKLNEVIADYLRAVEDGSAPDRGALMDQHPDLADGLRSFFVSHDQMNQAAGRVSTSSIDIAFIVFCVTITFVAFYYVSWPALFLVFLSIPWFLGFRAGKWHQVPPVLVFCGCVIGLGFLLASAHLRLSSVLQPIGQLSPKRAASQILVYCWVVSAVAVWVGVWPLFRQRGTRFSALVIFTIGVLFVLFATMAVEAIRGREPLVLGPVEIDKPNSLIALLMAIVAFFGWEAVRRRRRKLR